MGIAHPNFPDALWDGLSKNTARTVITDDQWPNQQDWDQIVQEVIEVERYLLANPFVGDSLTYEGDAATTIVKGQAIFVDASGDIGLADSSSNLISGMSVTDALSGETVIYIRQGRVTLPDWTLITGNTFLAPGQDYFVASNGSLSLTAPTSGYVIKIGQAQTTGTIDISIQGPIKL
jgi:hypothetical protein